MAKKRRKNHPLSVLVFLVFFGVPAYLFLSVALQSGQAWHVRVMALVAAAIPGLLFALILMFCVVFLLRAIRRVRGACYECGQPCGKESHAWHIGGRERKLCTKCHEALEQKQGDLRSVE